MQSISDQYQISDTFPRKFDASAWAGEDPIDNVTADQAKKLAAFINNLGSGAQARFVYVVGVVAATPDGVAGGSAPALPVELVVKNGHGADKLFYRLDVRVNLGVPGMAGDIFMVGRQLEALAAPSGSATSKILQFLRQVTENKVSDSDLLLGLDAVSVTVESTLSSLIDSLA